MTRRIIYLDILKLTIISLVVIGHTCHELNVHCSIWDYVIFIHTQY